MNNLQKKCYIWVDSIKLFACILVVLGHLYMSLMAGGWIQEEAVYYCLPIQTIYTFHVPLFFVCSGFLYQKKQTEYSFKEHIKTIKLKLITLGVPYFTFSIITLSLKNIFPAEVNHQAPPIIQSLFISPIAPYWYLHTLFLLFFIIPRFRKASHLKIVFVITILVKLLSVFLLGNVNLPDVTAKITNNAIWFVFGMVLANKKIKLRLKYKWITGVCVSLGGVLAFAFYRQNNSSEALQFACACLFVCAVLSMFSQFKYDRCEKKILKTRKYFMPVFLMHTIFAAGIRTILLKIGIKTLFIHLGMGIIASFVFPIIVYRIAEKHWLLMFWIEPQKAFDMKEKRNA